MGSPCACHENVVRVKQQHADGGAGWGRTVSRSTRGSRGPAGRTAAFYRPVSPLSAMCCPPCRVPSSLCSSTCSGPPAAVEARSSPIRSPAGCAVTEPKLRSPRRQLVWCADGEPTALLAPSRFPAARCRVTDPSTGSPQAGPVHTCATPGNCWIYPVQVPGTSTGHK